MRFTCHIINNKTPHCSNLNPIITNDRKRQKRFPQHTIYDRSLSLLGKGTSIKVAGLSSFNGHKPPLKVTVAISRVCRNIQCIAQSSSTCNLF